MKALRIIAVYGEMDGSAVQPEIVRHKDISPLLGNVLRLDSWQYEMAVHDSIERVRREVARQEAIDHAQPL